jgi:hypothetical protein
MAAETGINSVIETQGDGHPEVGNSLFKLYHLSGRINAYSVGIGSKEGIVCLRYFTMGIAVFCDLDQYSPAISTLSAS